MSGRPGRAVLRWLAGTWTVLVSTDEQDQPDVPVRVSASTEQLLVDREQHGPVSFTLASSQSHELSLAVDAGGEWADRGKFNRERARKVHYRITRRMPLEETILFEAWKGRQYSDSPRAIFEELRRRGDERRMVWAVEHHGVETPDGVEAVITGGRDYFRHLGRSRWVVSNDSMPTHFVKRDGVRYGQTWHGTPLKRIGFDIDNLQMSNKSYLEQFAREVTKWDALISPNPFSSEIFARAFRYSGPILEIGYPRNDVFFHEAERRARAAAVRERLGLPADRRIILYAPTWRDNQYDKSGRYKFSMKLDLERMYRVLGDEAVLLIRGHQLVAQRVDTSMFGGFARNVSTYPDISDLYLVADVLITDYSSVMFDYVNTGRPMLFYTYDLEAYRDDLRGFYFDFEAEAPGPLLGHTEQVIEALRSLDEVTASSAERYAAFREKFAGLEDGGASARFVDRFLLG
jgi:CDP-glycerol glycerophosphotransferase